MKKMNLHVVKQAPEGLFVLDRPRFIEGVALEELRKVYDEVAGANKYLAELKLDGEVATGSSPLITGALHDIFAPYGARPAIPVDDADGKISRMVEGKHYTDFNALVVQSVVPSYDKNKSFLENLIHQVEGLEGKVDFPFMITGFGVQSVEDPEGYNLFVKPGEDFRYIHDKRLAKESGSTFNTVDEEVGLPNFVKNGSRGWYRKSAGVSRLVLDNNLSLCANNGILSDSSANGRGALVAMRYLMVNSNN